MKTAQQLFHERLSAHRKEKNYYNKFIFNGHFSVFLVVLIGAFILGYGQWLQHMPSNINYALCVSVVLSMTSIFPLKTLLQDADRLFLLPFEKKMAAYIQKSVIHSYFSRMPLQILMLIIFYPLWHTAYPEHMKDFMIVVILALIFPFLSLLLKWEWYRYGLENWSIWLLLFVLHLCGYYVILAASDVSAFVAVFALVLLWLLLKRLNRTQLFPWVFMIAQAQQQQMNYYKFVNMFTDVKGLQEQAVRRRYLDFLLKTPRPFDQTKLYPFLFKRNFLRGKDALNMTIRLIVIIAGLMIWLHHPVVNVIMGSLAMYLIVLQMSQFYTQEAYSLWPQVWPVSEEYVIEGYRKFLQQMVYIIGTLLSIVYIILHSNYFYAVVLFFVIGFYTTRSTIKKLKYQEHLLKD
ncbi:ABC transporter permease EcsB [Staphylococcus lutrae]|uniref:Multidrug ABC transporter ATP-binding protein n=1 Tax=Staphylococcus lutrae TaxID=155085 RepID=A0AAC9RSR3_9STAP|nr:ABC transporter permease [Staphylococcus lutrae]ARJ50095.1 multidrug ABC transporter ATP-binding protein [Staphylococcus lutrae]PNZ37056.1 multidrug ABC transporter ATP-binding protein [Staphylococcus lutrae]